MEEHFTILKYHNFFILQHNIIKNVLKTFDMDFTIWKEIKNFNEEDSSLNGCLFTCAKFHR